MSQSSSEDFDGIGARVGVASSRPTLGTWFSIWVLVCLITAPLTLPLHWSGNEIHYFDLAYRFVRPDLFGDAHSVFDASQSRFVSYWLIGTTVEIFGFEAAKTVLGLFVWLTIGAALAAICAVLRLTPLPLAIALFIYIGNQSLLGEEWILGTVEAKVFAYVAVFFGLAAALKERWLTALLCTAAATYLHFLVGGFWGAAILVFHALRTADLRGTLRLFLSFSAIVLPIVALLALERMGGTGIDGGEALSDIYADFRNAHHVAPFHDGLTSFRQSWLSGLSVHLCLAFSLLVLRRSADGAERPFFTWVAGLNLYIPAALALAYLDRNTQVLAPFYMFRPSALILLLSLLACAASVPVAFRASAPSRIGAVAIIVSGAAAWSQVTFDRVAFAFLAPLSPPSERLIGTFMPEQVDLADWIVTNTDPGDMILMEPLMTLREGEAFPGALERVTGRPYYVNYKFVPVAPADLAEWYRRLGERQAAFDGDCEMVRRLQPAAMVFYGQRDLSPVRGCLEEVYRNDTFVVARPLD